MSTLDKILDYRRMMFDKSMALVEAKGHDYNRQQQEEGDTLFNLRVAAILGVVDTPEHAILVRLCDKLMRLVSLVDAEPAVADEAFDDTVVDIHNYVDYLAYMRMERMYEFLKDQEQQADPVAALMMNYDIDEQAALKKMRADEEAVAQRRSELARMRDDGSRRGKL